MEKIINIIEYLQKGNLWFAWLLLAIAIIYPHLKEDFKNNPRLKSLPYWYSCVLLVILVIEFLSSLSTTYTWLLIAFSTVVFIYVYLVKISIKFSHEFYLLKSINRNLNNEEIEDYEVFYNKMKKHFFSQLGKYNFGLSNLEYNRTHGYLPLCFKIIGDLQRLKLTKPEERKFLLKQFNVYSVSQAVRLWTGIYNSKKEMFSEEEQLLVDSLLAYYKLDLKLYEELSQKLLAVATNESYRQIALNNISVAAENNAQKTEWTNYVNKSFDSNHSDESNREITTLNLLDNLLYNNNLEKAEELFQELIQSIPVKTINNRVKIYNIKLHYYRQTNNVRQLNDVITTMFDEYHNTLPSKKHPLLISLLRLSFNHQILFDEVLTEVEKNFDDILNSDFSFVRWITNEILGIARICSTHQYMLRINVLVERCIEKAGSIDIDREISKLHDADVITKRCYIKFKSEISLIYLDNINIGGYKKRLLEKFRILDELITFDEKQGLLINLLDSLFLKLDEVISALDIFTRQFKSPQQSDEMATVGKELIEKILPIIQLADNSLMMAEHHLKLAHYFCCLNNKIEGNMHFRKFRNSNVQIQNYATWLQEWFWRLDGYLKEVV